MALPLRLNLATVKIRRLTLASTNVDSDFQENTSTKVYAAEENFSAQVTLNSEERRVRMPLGNVPMTDGHLVYRAPTVAANRLKKGDRITGLPDGAGGYDVVDYVVCENIRHGNLPNPLTYHAYFKRNEDNVNSHL